MDTKCSKTDKDKDGWVCGDSGNTNLNIEGGAKNIHIESHVDKSTIVLINTTSDAIATSTDPRLKTCCKVIDNNNNKLCDVFKQKLQHFYRNLTLPKVAWLKDGKDLSIVEHFIQLRMKESQKSITVEQIFKSKKRKKPLRILIEGQPGFGKTTLATKLTYDWAVDKKYINFQFVFFIPLRELQKRSINNVIKQIANRCNSEDVVQIITNHEKNMLLIFDGLDEIPREERKEILKILYRQMYEDATVMVFCRTDSFDLSNDERVELFGLQNMGHSFQCKQISILGVTSDEKKRDFLEKFIENSTVDQIIERLSSQWALFDSPLLLMLLVVILQEGENVEDFLTKTEFYKKLFNSIFKQFYIKRGHNINTDFDLFCLNSPHNVQETMREFGSLAAQKIFKNNLKFDSSELTKEIYELGFLISHKEVTFVKSKTHYEALHLSIIEFASAFSFWMNLKLNKPTTIEDDLKLIVNHFFETKGTSRILPFIAGLMEDQLDHLLSCMDSFSAWLSLNFYLSANLLSECLPMNISKSENLISFIPSHVDCSYCSSDDLKLKELLVYGSECGKLEKITINEQTDLQIFSNEITACFQMAISFHFTVLGNVHLFSNPIPFEGELNELLHFATSTNCKSCSLRLSTPLVIAQFRKLMIGEKLLSKIKYNYLEIIIRNLEKVEKETIINLMEENQVQYLYLRPEKNIMFDMSDFSRAAAQSNYLASISLYHVTIDLYDLTNGGTKKYTYLSLHQCTVTCRKSLPVLLKNCCHHLQIERIENMEAIIEMEPSTLLCFDGTIDNLMYKYPKWTGFNSVTSLSLSCYRGLNSAYSFINLQTLYIPLVAEIDQNELAKSIHNLQIVNLIFDNLLLKPLNLFKYMIKLWAENNNSRLKTIVLQQRPCNRHKSGVFDLIEGVARNHWDKVYFLNCDFNFRDFVQSLWCSHVQVTHANFHSICSQLDVPAQSLSNYYYYDVNFDPKIFSVSKKCHQNKQEV
uniref:NACHT domain-containing protein n=1 Tax=Strigamia maritima TaxID=126957 RepID=T1J9V0_STRMM